MLKESASDLTEFRACCDDLRRKWRALTSRNEDEANTERLKIMRLEDIVHKVEQAMTGIDFIYCALLAAACACPLHLLGRLVKSPLVQVVSHPWSSRFFVVAVSQENTWSLLSDANEVSAFIACRDDADAPAQNYAKAVLKDDTTKILSSHLSAWFFDHLCMQREKIEPLVEFAKLKTNLQPILLQNILLKLGLGRARNLSYWGTVERLGAEFTTSHIDHFLGVISRTGYNFSCFADDACSVILHFGPRAVSYYSQLIPIAFTRPNVRIMKCVYELGDDHAVELAFENLISELNPSREIVIDVLVYLHNLTATYRTKIEAFLVDQILTSRFYWFNSLKSIHHPSPGFIEHVACLVLTNPNEIPGWAFCDFYTLVQRVPFVAGVALSDCLERFASKQELTSKDVIALACVVDLLPIPGKLETSIVRFIISHSFSGLQREDAICSYNVLRRWSQSRYPGCIDGNAGEVVAALAGQPNHTRWVHVMRSVLPPMCSAQPYVSFPIFKQVMQTFEHSRCFLSERLAIVSAKAHYAHLDMMDVQLIVSLAGSLVLQTSLHNV